MSKPIFVIAGQSNAGTVLDEVRESLSDLYGDDGFILISSYANGAPLTYQKGGDDWKTDSELLTDLTDKTVSALQDSPGSVVEGMIWVQGEGDAYGFAPTHNYDDMFQDLLSDFSNAVEEELGDRYTGIDDANIVISSLSDNARPSATQTQWDLVIDEHIELANSDPDITVVHPDDVAQHSNISGDDMFRDALHYSDEFSIALAEELVRQVTVGVDKSAFVQCEIPNEPPNLDTLPDPEIGGSPSISGFDFSVFTDVFANANFGSVQSNPEPVQPAPTPVSPPNQDTEWVEEYAPWNAVFSRSTPNREDDQEVGNSATQVHSAPIVETPPQTIHEEPNTLDAPSFHNDAQLDAMVDFLMGDPTIEEDLPLGVQQYSTSNQQFEHEPEIHHLFADFDIFM